MKYDKDMDEEMIPICNLLNKFKGVTTTFSCFGHYHPGSFYICFRCSNIKSLKSITKCFEPFYQFTISIEYLGPDSKPAKKNEIAVDIRQMDFDQTDKIVTYTIVKDICKHLRKQLKQNER